MNLSIAILINEWARRQYAFSPLLELCLQDKLLLEELNLTEMCENCPGPSIQEMQNLSLFAAYLTSACSREIVIFPRSTMSNLRVSAVLML